MHPRDQAGHAEPASVVREIQSAVRAGASVDGHRRPAVLARGDRLLGGHGAEVATGPVAQSPNSCILAVPEPVQRGLPLPLRSSPRGFLACFGLNRRAAAARHHGGPAGGLRVEAEPRIEAAPPLGRRRGEGA